MERSLKRWGLLAIMGISALLVGLPVPAVAVDHVSIDLTAPGTANQRLTAPTSISGTNSSANGTASASADLPTGLLTISVSTGAGGALARAQFVNDRLIFSGPAGETSVRVRFTSTVKASILRSGPGGADVTSVFSIAKGGSVFADSANITYINNQNVGFRTTITLGGVGQVEIISASETDLEAVSSIEVDVPLGPAVGLSNFIDSSPNVFAGSTGAVSGSAQVAVILPLGYSFTSEGTLLSARPMADIKANGSDTPVTLFSRDTLSVTVAMDKKGRTDNADWWLAVQTPSGLYFYTFTGWTSTLQPAYQGALFTLPSFEVLNIPVSVLPAGTYTFFFGVDTVMDGTVTMGSAYYDFVQVNVVK
jgi:hypothetical protein